MDKNKLIKIFCVVLMVLFTFIAIYLVIGASSKDIINQYDAVKPDNNSGFSKAISFLRSYVQATGDTVVINSITGLDDDDVSYITGSGDGEEESETEESSTVIDPGGGGTTNHKHIAWRQSNYSDKITSSCSISGGGCGWCSLTSAMAELNSSCASMQPNDWLTIMPDSVKKWWTSSGMVHSGAGAWIDYVNSLGTYGTYVGTDKYDGGVATEKIIGFIMEVDDWDNTVMVISNSAGLFTGGGHITLITDAWKDSNGDWYCHIDDSSSKSSTNLKKSWSDMCTYPFPIYSDEKGYITSLNGYNYSWKWCYKIERVD